MGRKRRLSREKEKVKWGERKVYVGRKRRLSGEKEEKMRKVYINLFQIKEN